MCGIFGILAAPARLPAQRQCEAALAMLAHRGPDARQLLHRPEVGLALGHVRLSILDVDARSHQPFVAPGCVLVFNGEIYNFRQLRAELEQQGVVFRTSSDTEVIALGYGRWGSGIFDRLRGMFAIALWDERQRCLHLVRDEFGIKPLCVLQRGGQVVFASEVKAIAALHSLGIDGAVLGDLLSWGFAMRDASLFDGVEFVPPGTHWTLQCTGNGVVRTADRPLWRTRQAWLERHAEPTDADLRDVVSASVADHMIADVPVAVALSGGLDSSIVAVVASQRTRGLQALTFTLAPPGTPDSEVEHAAALAQHVGLAHQVVRLPRIDVVDWLRHVAWHLEEPIANVNALPGFALAAAVRASGHKVVLVGEGSDEVFAGYPWYRFALEPGAAADPGGVFDRYRRRRAQASLTRCLRPEAQQVAQQQVSAQRASFVARVAELGGDPLAGFQSVDLETQLQYSQLLRVDRMFMAHGVEARVPFLYRSVLQAAAALPAARKLLSPEGPGRREKVALGAAFSPLLPPAIAMRPKFGATGTVDIWSTWLGEALVQAFERAVHSRELAGARELLAPLLDWDAVAAAPLGPKERFALALLLESVQVIAVAQRAPTPMSWSAFGIEGPS